MKTRPFVTGLVLLAASGTAWSAALDLPLTDPVIWSNAGTAIRVGMPNIVNNWACTDPDSYFVQSTLSQQVQSRILAVLLTAKALGRPVTVRLDGCESNRPAITAAFF